MKGSVVLATVHSAVVKAAVLAVAAHSAVEKHAELDESGIPVAAPDSSD